VVRFNLYNKAESEGFVVETESSIEDGRNDRLFLLRLSTKVSAA